MTSLEESKRWCATCQLLTKHLMDPQEWRCLRCHRQFDRIAERRGLAIKLWGNARNGPNYKKEEWQHFFEIMGLNDEA